MTSRAERWRVALHESAHIVTARAVNSWNCTASARVSDTGRGVATMPHGLTRFADAVASAAGTYGEESPFEAPARRRRPPLPPAETADGIRARAARQCNEEAAQANFAGARSDDEAVAAYCISLHPGDPDEWVAAHARVHDEAKRLTWDLRDEIKRVAMTLFHRGKVTLKGDPEHDQIFAAGAVASGATMPE